MNFTGVKRRVEFRNQVRAGPIGLEAMHAQWRWQYGTFLMHRQSEQHPACVWTSPLSIRKGQGARRGR